MLRGLAISTGKVLGTGRYNSENEFSIGIDQPHGWVYHNEKLCVRRAGVDAHYQRWNRSVVH